VHVKVALAVDAVNPGPLNDKSGAGNYRLQGAATDIDLGW